MKRFFFTSFLFLLLQALHAATFTWDGEAMNQRWDDPLNWTTDLLPGPGDEVLLDNSVMAGSYQVLLPEGDVAVSILRLEIRPDAGYGIRLILPATNISTTAFRATGDGDAVILHTGAVFVNESGATLSSTPVAVSSAGYFRIGNGARYIHRTARSATDNLVSRLSTEPGTETGVFEFDVTVASYIISLSGRVFGSLELSSAANAALVNYRGSGGNSFTVRGDLWLHDNVSFNLSLSAATIIEGSLRTDALSVFNLQSTDNSNPVSVRSALSLEGIVTETGTGSPVLVLDGSSMQPVLVRQALQNEVKMRLDNPAGCDLLLPLQINHRLEMLRGNIFSGNFHALEFGSGASYERTGGLVETNVRKINPAGFEFPVGMGSVYAPLLLAPDASTGTDGELAVRYHRSNPQSAIGPTLEPADGPIDHISNVEYWSLEGTASMTGRVNCVISEASFCRNLAGTFLTQSDGLAWRRRESVVADGPLSVAGYETGRLSTLNGIPLQGYISPGSALSFAENPLPLHLLSFNALPAGGYATVLEWSTAEVPEPGTSFKVSVLRTGDDSLYRDLFITAMPAGQHVFRSHAISLGPGMTRFRLEARTSDGLLMDMKTTGLRLDGPEGFLMIAMYPNPVENRLQVSGWSPAKGAGEIRVYAMDGRVVKRSQLHLHAGMNESELPMDDLPPGVYLLEILTGGSPAGGKRLNEGNRQLFIKR